MAKPHADRFVSTDLRELIDNVIFMLQPQALLYNVEVKFDRYTKDSRICCEPNQLKQVFINLIKNSIEAMPAGGVIRVVLDTTNSSDLRIVFSDQGTGISEDQIPHLGKPFYTTKEKGTGLGLMVCYKIIEAHHGHMAIQSEIGIGTTMVITLPTNPNK